MISQLCRTLAMLACLASIPGAAGAAGLLTPKNGSLPALELAQHHVDVTIEDGFAITRVEQVFSNPHAQDLEARYSFPLPDKASVAEFTMWIDGQAVTAEVLEKKQARHVYEEEKQAGRDAGLTEQDGYKTFDISVAPIRAGGDTRIRLMYYQPTDLDTGIGRYVYPLEDGGVDEQRLAFWTTNEQVRDHFSFALRLRSSYSIDAVRVPGHAARVSQQGPGEWQVHLDRSNPGTGAAIEEGAIALPGDAGPAASLDNDLVVYWRLTPGLPGSVDIITYKPTDTERGTFMLVVTPGDDLQPIREGRDWSFVLDVSGSMKGKYATLVDGVSRALKEMGPDDRFRITLFNSGAKELTSGFTAATPEAVARTIDRLEQITPSHGTNLFAGLQLGLRGIDADRTSSVVLVTDGVANVGETAQRKFLELVAQRDLRLFTFVMGNSANRPLLETLTRASGGFAVSISNADDIVGQLLLAASKVSHQALHGVSVDIDGVRTGDLTPTHTGSLYRGDQLVLFGHYWGSGDARLRVRGKISGEDHSYSLGLRFPETALDHPEIERLWAFAQIRDLADEIADFGEQADLKTALVDLALEYSLVTDYTSMVVLREDGFDERGIERRNHHRLLTEQAAQQQRLQQPLPSQQVAPSPAYQNSRPSLGAGAIDAWWLIALLPLLALRRRRSA